MQASDLYLELLKRCLTNTLFEEEPDADDPNATAYVGRFISHYMKGPAITMLPRARLDNLQHCIAHAVASDVPGDLIETGVWRGGATIFMRGVLKAHGVGDRTVWVADSFEGLPEPDAEKHPVEAEFFNSRIMKKFYNNFAADIEHVRSNFAAFGLLDDQVRFLKGWFKHTLPSAPIERLAVMRLDGDYYDSTMDALNNLYHKLSVGGFAIIDDYGEDAWTNCRQAVDTFRLENGIGDPLIRVDSKCYYWQRAR